MDQNLENKKFERKLWLFFSISKSICCGCSKDPYNEPYIGLLDGKHVYPRTDAASFHKAFAPQSAIECTALESFRHLKVISQYRDGAD